MPFFRLIPLAVTAFLALPLVAQACIMPAGASAARAAMIQAVNAERRAQGLPALSSSPKLDRAAQQQACDNAARRSISHTGADGSELATRLKRAGYRYRIATENTGRGFAQPQNAVDWWMNSGKHRTNILLRKTREIGVGLALSDAPESRNHWIIVMGASK
ncbi:CAP domain-containing protein [Fertoebacter nigrum]|uniref:CAP domain-containing protein n=1 Tax=Fertoeibacter niger TaxID=2656921 RepID=A0A8X8KSJ6_9RHOB|nr:CAP domain-containing protein [Fertoeibacter niger]NUB46567.1 CAP domain-containing protein [Fertoeibacter niger]